MVKTKKRRLRGKDFEIKWLQGRWSENILKKTLNDNKDFFSISYGTSGIAPEDPIEQEKYFELLHDQNDIKQPDLLVFKRDDFNKIDKLLKSIGGEEKIQFTEEKNSLIQELLEYSFMGIECEQSLWKVSKMKDFNRELTPQKRLDGKLGLPKTAITANIMIKEEDKDRLQNWQKKNDIKIHVWHVFYDKAYGIKLDAAMKLVEDGLIEPTIQVFNEQHGGQTKKIMYKIYNNYAYFIGDIINQPKVNSGTLEADNGKIYPYAYFSDGDLNFSNELLNELHKHKR